MYLIIEGKHYLRLIGVTDTLLFDLVFPGSEIAFRVAGLFTAHKITTVDID